MKIKEIIKQFPECFTNCSITGASNIPINLSYIVEQDKLYAGEYPRYYEESESQNKVNQFILFGITDFIDLTEEEELFPYIHFLPIRYRTLSISNCR
jgi:hypothetical protein